MIHWNSPNLPLQNFLCLDLGTKKTGIAHNFPINSIATPHKTIETQCILTEIITLQQNHFSYIIVGIPMAYPESESHQFIENFVNYLQEQLPEMNFIFWDESHTSQMVRDQHKHGRKGFSKKFHKNYDSKVAALILSSFLV